MRPAEQIARAFHESYERLAPLYRYSTREDTRSLDVTSPNGKLMVAVCEELLERGLIAFSSTSQADRLQT